jgi:hypothetical protein
MNWAVVVVAIIFLGSMGVFFYENSEKGRKKIALKKKISKNLENLKETFSLLNSIQGDLSKKYYSEEGPDSEWSMKNNLKMKETSRLLSLIKGHIDEVNQKNMIDKDFAKAELKIDIATRMTEKVDALFKKIDA